MLELSTDLIGGKTESGDDVGQGIVLLENLEVYALGTKFKAGVRVFGKQGKEGLCKPRYVFEGEAVTIVSGKKPTWFIRRFLGFSKDFILEIVVIDEKDVVGGGKHSLQETVTAVVQTIEEVGKVEIAGAPDSVACGHVVKQWSALAGKDQRGFLLLEAETLSTRVEHVFVMSAWNQGGLRITPKDFLRFRMIEDSLLMVDDLDHGRILCSSMIFRSSEIACLGDLAAEMTFMASLSGKPRA